MSDIKKEIAYLESIYSFARTEKQEIRLDELYKIDSEMDFRNV